MRGAAVAHDHAPMLDELVERILGSTEFRRSERLSRFLRYIVDETVAGRADRIKAYSIALAVFDKPDTFDPQADPLVRVEAGRLRNALERYYAAEGQDDPIVVTIPKGGYVPHFEIRNRSDEARRAMAAEVGEKPGRSPIERPMVPEPTSKRHPGSLAPRLHWRPAAVLAVIAAFITGGWLSTNHRPAPTASEAARAQTAPSIAVLPFRYTGDASFGKDLAAGMGDAVMDQLVRFRDLRVVGRETATAIPGSQEAFDALARYNVQYVLEGSINSASSHVAVSARLVDVASRHVLWSTRSMVDSTGDAFAAQLDIATQIARTLAQPYGVVFRTEASRNFATPPARWTTYQCILSFYQYRAELTPSRLREMKDCLVTAVGEAPGYASGWAMLSMVFLDEVRLGLHQGPSRATAIERARDAAERAVGLEPDNLRALQALLMASFFASDVEGGKAIGDLALTINPFDTEILGEYGSRIAQAGEWTRGTELVKAAVASNPANASYFHALIALNEVMSGRPAEALNHLGLSNLDKVPLFQFISMLVYAENGRMADARTALARVEMRQPSFLAGIDEELRMRNFRPADAERVKAILDKVRREPSRSVRLDP